jgi:peptide/nickel transport system substrate-binding protein
MNAEQPLRTIKIEPVAHPIGARYRRPSYADGRGVMRRLVVLMTVSAIAIASCTGGSNNVEDRLPQAPAPERGGTLRVVIPQHPISTLSQGTALDPQKDWWPDSFEIFRCCLLRTLLAHPGVPTEEGGSRLFPDLAAEMPTISSDGRTWTFRLKDGIRYSPPLQDTLVVAADFIRALEREAAVARQSYAFYYSVIEGFDAMMNGEANSISGLEAPNDTTLIVHLTQPAGDLANLFAMPATAPIPPSPLDPSSRFGVAEGLPNFGPFLVATGPYMIEGSKSLDLSSPAEDRVPISGYVPGSSLTLVRNPSWNREDDELRPAYVERIEFIIGPRIGEAVEMIERGDADLFVFENPAPQIPVDVVQRFLDRPELGVRIKIEPRDLVRYVSINLAVPPLDDIHVRRAINHAIDKDALLDLRGGRIVGDVADHIVLDSMEDGFLSSYDPYPTSLAEARAEMALSRYDEDDDGRCDAPACKGLELLSALGYPKMRQMAENVRRDLTRIGIEVSIETAPRGREFEVVSDPRANVPLALFTSWGKDYLNASTFIAPLFSSEAVASPNYSLVGATPAQLRRWGYEEALLPNIDDKIDECLALVGELQVRCWVEADQLLMENVVPWVPYVFENKVHLLGERVASYSFDQFTTSPALDRISLSGDAA